MVHPICLVQHVFTLSEAQVTAHIRDCTKGMGMSDLFKVLLGLGDTI